jgi:hypothetical protein
MISLADKPALRVDTLHERSLADAIAAIKSSDLPALKDKIFDAKYVLDVHT